MSNPILKTNVWQPIQLGDAKMIDNNDKVEEKLHEIEDSLREKFGVNQSVDEFQEGLSAEDISTMVDAGQMSEDEDGETTPIIKFDAAAAEEEAQARIQEMYDQAQAEIDQMQVQMQQAYEDAQNQGFEEGQKAGYEEGLAAGREDGAAQGHEDGYAQGHEEGLHSLDEERKALEAEYQEKMQALDEAYQQQIDEMEPKFIDILTSVYEHVLKIDLKNNREMIVHLISDAMKNIEGKTGFMVHVSKEDYPYVSMQKKELVAGCGVDVNEVEIVEDASLHKNECIIETDGGVFDCSLGTQLDALKDEIQLLAFQHTKPDWNE